MLLKVDTVFLLLEPLNHQTSQDDAITPDGTIYLIQQNMYKAYMFTVHSNLKIEPIVHGMAPSDIQHGLNISNFGVTILQYYSPCSVHTLN